MNDYYYSWMRQQDAVDWPVNHAVEDQFCLADGRRIYDFISTSFQANFGHSHSLIRQRIATQLDQMPIASPKSTFALKQNVSERLNHLISRGAGKIFYTVSGSESVENALKIARQMRGAKIVLARQKSYHGASLGALSVTGDWRNGPHLTFDEGTVRIPDHIDDQDAAQVSAIVQQHGPENIAAIILETISGTNGMSVPTKEWFSNIQSICQRHGIFLIADEVLVGFRRCGTDFAFHHYDLEPDLVCMSKAISGGYIPFGAVWTNESIADHYETEILACGLTNYGHPLGLAALDGVLATLEDAQFAKGMSSLEKTFAGAISSLTEVPSVTEIRQRGLMAAIELDRPAPTWQQAFDAGLHLFSKNNLIILAPPYVSTTERLLTAINVLRELITE